MEVNNILQELIYLFNEDGVRNSIINRVLKQNKTRYVWKGTFMLSKDEPFNNIVNGDYQILNYIYFRSVMYIMGIVYIMLHSF